MATMIVRHRVADYAAWKPVFDEHQGFRAQGGVIAHSLYRDADDANMVTMVFAVTDLGRAREFATSADLRQVMERAGVQGQPDIWFLDDVEEKTY
jgi:hypothetical protein